MLDQKCLMILDDFKRLKPQLDILSNFINDKLHEIASSLNMMLNSIETRVKSEKSLEGKLDLKGYKYNKISATECRQHLKNNEYNLWCSKVPVELWENYEKYRNLIKKGK